MSYRLTTSLYNRERVHLVLRHRNSYPLRHSQLRLVGEAHPFEHNLILTYLVQAARVELARL